MAEGQMQDKEEYPDPAVAGCDFATVISTFNTF
jgi:hypothetical protein